MPDARIRSVAPGESTSDFLAPSDAEPDAADSRCGSSEGGRVAVLGSGKGSNARAIFAAAASGDLGGKVALALSDVPGSGVLEAAREHGVAAFAIDPGSVRRGALSDAALEEILDRLRAARIDLVALAGFMRVMREPLLSAFAGRILNLHPSLLPAYPGLDPVARALAAGESETGCTVHLVDAGIDTGEILRQERVPIRPGDTVETLAARIHAAEHRLYPQVIADRLAALRR